jgi:predicted dehydrogenase
MTSRNQKLTRREAIRTLAAAAGFPTIIPASALGKDGVVAPSERISLGCIGVGSMGSGHVQGFLNHPDVRITAVCDVHQAHRERAKSIVDRYYKDTACAEHHDFRELLARPDVDAVMIATPEHWHPLIGIEAARRGKHMYYEKPMSVSVAEAQAVRQAVKRYGVVFQFGTQQRSSQAYRFTCELIRNGRIGQLQTVMIGSAGGRYDRIPDRPPQPVPQGFDYDMWLGPAPWAPYCDERVSRTWMFISDYGLGCLGGAWGIHDVDIAQWVNDSDGVGPVEVEGSGRFYDDIRDVVYSWEVEHKYPNGVRVIHMDMVTAQKRAPQFRISGYMASVMIGSKGWIYVSRQQMQTYPESLMHEVIGPDEAKVIKSNDHRRNFLDAIRTGKRTISHIDAAVSAEIMCQQAEIAMRLRKKLHWDPQKEVFLDCAEANRMLLRPMRSPWRI